MGISLESVSGEIISILAPLPSYFSSTDKAVETFNRLGYGPSAADLAPVAADLAQLADDINKLVDAGEQFAADRAAGNAGLTELLKLIAEIALVLKDLAAVPGKLPALNLDPKFFLALFQMLVVDYLRQERPALYASLELLGVIDQSFVPAQAGGPAVSCTKLEIHWDRLVQIVEHTGQWARDVYGWGTSDFRHALFLLRVSSVFDAFGLFAPVVEIPDDILTKFFPSGATLSPRPQSLRFPLYHDEPAPDTVVELGIMGLPVEGKTAPTDQDVGIGVMPYADGVVEGTIPITDELEVAFSGSAEIAGGIVVALRPSSGLELTLPSQSDIASTAKLRIELARKPPPGSQTVVLLGEPDSMRLDTQRAFLGTGFELHNLTPDVLIDAGMKGGRIVITLSEADGFLAKVLPPDGITLHFDFRIGWSQSKGLYFQGSGALETTLALNATLGPVYLESLWILFGFSQDGLQLQLGLTGGVEIGPVSASVERIGMQAVLSFKEGNLGPVDLGFGFKPPNGLGVAVNAGVVSGGGFVAFDEPNHRYSGVLSLEILSVSVTVIGLVETKLPDGRDGYSFLLIVCVEFSPIQLGFGFTLNGVGGLAGIHRGMNVEALRTGIYTGSLDHILFPQDPIANAPQLISDLSRIFPAAEGQYTFGPMAKFGWGAGDIVTITLGIVIQLPSPLRIALLGQIACYLPVPEEAIVEIHIDFIATIDFEAKLFALDATLRDSRILLFTLTGDMAMRLSWGDQPNFTFAMGGFHPHYPTPPGFPVLRRLTLALGAGDWIRLTCQTYQAITSNSLQFGARVDLSVEVGVSIHGWLGFDVLFIFSPFSFEADFSAGLSVSVAGISLASLTVDGILSGPTPWRIRGEAKISILFFEISVHVDEQFGRADPASLPVVDPWPDMLTAAAEPHNWEATLPAGVVATVSLAAGKGDKSVLLDPAGQVTWRQHVAPLERQLTLYKNAATPAPTTFSVDRVTVGASSSKPPTVDDFFAAAQFQQLSDADKLSRPSFDKMPGGVTVTSTVVQAGPGIPATIEYETRLVDSETESRSAPTYQLPLRVQIAHGIGAAAARSALRNGGNRAFTGPSKFTESDEQFEIVSTRDLGRRHDITAPTSKGAAWQALDSYLSDNLDEEGELAVAPVGEAEGS